MSTFHPLKPTPRAVLLLSPIAFFGYVFLFTFSAVAEQAAASQPSQIREEKYPKIHCSELAIKYGFEGNCQVETLATTWQIGYTREGKENRKKTGTVRNLIVLFHADGFSHRVHEWWESIVGQKKAIDTDDWTVLSLGTPGDFNPPLGSPIFLSVDEILTVQTAVVDYLYPQAKFIVGGPSRGGQIAILWTIKNPDRVKKLILVGIHGYAIPDEEPILKYLEDRISTAEKALGPYANWNDQAKIDWWKEPAKGYVRISYTDEYFRNPKWMIEQGAKPTDYVNPEKFRVLTENVWIDYFKKYISPVWYVAQIKALQSAMDHTPENEFKKLPDDILLVGAKGDQTVLSKDTTRFYKTLKQFKKSITWVEIEDPRGHMASVSAEMPAKTIEAIKKFL